LYTICKRQAIGENSTFHEADDERIKKGTRLQRPGSSRLQKPSADSSLIGLGPFNLFGIQAVNPPNEQVSAVASVGHTENDLPEKTCFVKSG